MEPTHEELPAVDSLPQPGNAHSPENQPMTPEIGINQPSQAPAAQPLNPPQMPAQLSSVPVPQVSQSTIPTDDQMIADDTDLIEKEWVSKAKAIVAQTKHDPHLQTNEMSKVKANYVKKRYNKDLKLSE